jgi:hypothetical protein
MVTISSETGELNSTEEKEEGYQQSLSKIRELIKTRDSAQAYTWLRPMLLAFLGKSKVTSTESTL